MTEPTSELQQAVALSADAADLHATVPTLLLELQTLLGTLTAAVTAGTERGRRPFRPGPDWPAKLGDLAYGVYLLADQTNVDVNDAVRRTSVQLHQRGQQARAAGGGEWPFEVH